ncbi:hypothetical protein PV721_16800 [Streptomyces sp. MB09-01]|uniref:hypothetical protein n=1 Tax=Streptomyces sp. MB09-01 TaxID=3028666 RepID=UPI0029BA2761|nr:hypothetical protein [Streptomyces sp. MB09-01]MDX3535999.1 hypothetical protein [Streptomyces sp. MB09-01]
MEHVQTTPDQLKQEETAPDQGTADPRRRRRTTLLIAGAAVLGVLAGTITGYAIQYDREPTPLPPLAQQKMDAPKPAAVTESSTWRSINANRWHEKADEDLVKKLVDAPGGAKVEFSGAQTADEFAAEYYETPVEGVGSLIRDGIRSIAAVNWSEGDRNFVEIHLLRFRDRSGAEDFQAGVQEYMPTKKFAGNLGTEVPGVPGDFGQLWVDAEADEKPGYLPLRGASAIVRRGDTVVHIRYLNNRGQIDQSVVADLAKRQMERL